MEEQCDRNQKIVLSSDTDRIEAKAIGSFGDTKIIFSQGRLIDHQTVKAVEVHVEISGRRPSGHVPFGGHGSTNITWKGSVDDLGKIIAIGIAMTEYIKNADEK